MKDKSKLLIKEAKKAAQKSIQQNLAVQLTEITGKLGQISKKLDKQIIKESRKLAKKISKEIKFDKAALIEADNKTKVTKSVDTPKEGVKGKAKAAVAVNAGTAAKKPDTKVVAL